MKCKQKSLRQIARELGVSASYLSQVKHGKRPPSDKVLSILDQSVKQTPGGFECAEGGTRTHTSLRRADFKSAASAIPPPRQEVSKKVEAASGVEPLNRGFADPRLNHLATPP